MGTLGLGQAWIRSSWSTAAAIGSHGYWGVLLCYELCLNGHIRFRADIENAVKYARNSEHLSRTQNATCGNQMSSHNSVITHPWGISCFWHINSRCLRNSRCGWGLEPSMVRMLLVEVVVRFGLQFRRKLFQHSGKYRLDRLFFRGVTMPD